MEDRILLDTIERYLNGSMLEEEKKYFQQLRKTTPEIDQMVVEHRLFLQHIDSYAEHRTIAESINNVHNNLIATGEINDGKVLTAGGKIVQLWNRYKRVTAIAASIAGIVALTISGLLNYVAPPKNQVAIQELSKKLNNLEKKTNALNNEIKKDKTKIPEGAILNTGGSGFLIDGKGYIITNAHILKGTGAVVVNNKNQEFKVRIAYVDQAKDIAVLKIDDSEYVTLATLPYSIKRNNTDLGEEIYTLGYPRDEIVYNLGYLSAKTGIDGDTASMQISLSANPGNSGGPVFNKNGEVIGILSSREKQAEGVVFAIKSKGIYQVIDDLKNADTSYQRIKLPVNTSLKGVERTKQISKIEDCVFQVKVYN